MTGLEFEEYQAQRIINVHKHVDGPWFWDKYSATPYVGCQSGCEFCYLRGGRHLGRHDPNSFDTLIRVKTNAAELLCGELGGLRRDVIACGDWQQTAENRYRLSRRMLDVIRDLCFPLMIIERSPLVVRDLDLLMEINRKSWVGVALSISSLDSNLKQAFEPHSPGLKIRLQAMETLASAGILVGTALMPILPFVGDDGHHLEEVVRATSEHGGSFVMAGGLTIAGEQAQRSFKAARALDPALEARWRKLYGWEKGDRLNYSPPQAYSARVGLLVRELCTRYGLRDRMPRYIAPGPMAVNRRIAERLFLRTYELELEQEIPDRIWAHRKAAWAVDEWPESIETLYSSRRELGLQELPGIGPNLAGEIGDWLREEMMEKPVAKQG